MARGINKVILVATAGNDAEVRYMPSGAAVANVSLATNEEWTDKQTGQKQSRVEWHRVTFMDRGNFRLGQIAGDFIKKGSKVYVEGSLRTREWEKDGIKRYTTEIIANEMQLLDSRSDEGNQVEDQQRGSYGQEPKQSGYDQNQQRPQQQSNQQAKPQSYGSWGNQPNGYANAQGGFSQPQGQTAHQQSQQQRPLSQQASPQQQSPNSDDFDDDIPFN